ncbi:hypothetical protein J2S00_003642 [Caldalkalibacillus uzonensis]|uniref:DUF2642 domain-containing protein n=1 Tax=Caldalkalibacillus uzonensis TaxID=353224 RepID=A0ABU0CXR0_9BACI|nr:hypothetical protein [Caldalkalibacillus uzonensis]MDQ0340802.1 hypothetical protein [Caldalkalibacillus uzonensis]
MPHPMYHIARRYMGMPVEIRMVDGGFVRGTICGVTPYYVDLMPLGRGVSTSSDTKVQTADGVAKKETGTEIQVLRIPFNEFSLFFYFLLYCVAAVDFSHILTDGQVHCHIYQDYLDEAEYWITMRGKKNNTVQSVLVFAAMNLKKLATWKGEQTVLLFFVFIHNTPPSKPSVQKRFVFSLWLVYMDQ